MIKSQSQSGFSVIELLITLFIAGAFLIAGYQLYSTIVKNSSDAQVQSRASGIADEYLQKYKSRATNPCSAQSILNSTKLQFDDLSNVNISVLISCPYGTNSNVSKITSTITYNTPQQTYTIASYVNKSCPTGYIQVPGNKNYGTDDFCVMKYEAKNDGTGKAVSTNINTPWVNIPQVTAQVTAAAACTNCHLMTEAEWMTIATNVASVASNWSTGTVGSGFIYSGHNDNSPSNALTADTNDNNGYLDTGNTTGSNQRRTLTLTNGEVIWDLAGNVWEWTSGVVAGGQPGITGGGAAWREWTAITNAGSLNINLSPGATNIAGASSWNSNNGIGQIYSNSDDSTLRGILRGGSWLTGSSVTGIFSAYFYAPSSSASTIGFRVVSPTLTN